MKRYFALALVALFLVPVLAIGAAAAEVYIFEYTELPAVYSDDYLFQWDDGFMFLGSVPPGIYTLKWNIDGVEGSWSDPVVLSFEMSLDLNGTPVRASLFDTADNQQWGAIKDFDDTVCFLILPFDCTGPFETATASLIRVGDLPGSSVTSGDFMAVFEPVANQISVKSAVGVLAYGTGGCVGMGFGWWGIRKGVRALMAAFRSGKFKL